MSERPTLTIAVSCPTCGGTNLISGPGTFILTDHGRKFVYPKCPDCTDGTIRQAVSCQSCRWFNAGMGTSPHDGMCEYAEQPRAKMTAHRGRDYIDVTSDFGCLSWQAREGA